MGKLTRGNRNIAWIEEFCKVPEGKDVGKPVKLRPWQKKMIRAIYDTPTRRALISFGRKNGKTALAAFLCLLHLVGPEARKNSQLYSCAQSREQAAILFNLMVKIIRQSVDLEAVTGVRESAKQVYCDELGTLYRALSADSSTAMGLSPVFVVHDELGQVRGPNFPLYDALESACGAQEEPLSVVISTQASTDDDLLSVLIDDALAGHDPETKCFLYVADEDADPFSAKAIKQANPAYGDFNNPKELKRRAADAKRMPTSEAEYRNLNLNQRISRHTRLIPPAVWKLNGKTPREADFLGNSVIGVDLSQSHDLTALTLVGQGDDGQFSVKTRVFMPEEGLDAKSVADRVPYSLWVKQGHVIATPGRTVGYDFVIQQIVEWCEAYNIELIEFDRWRIQDLRAEAKSAGFDDLPFSETGHGQGFKDMGPAISTLESECLNESLRHGNNPVLTWCQNNAVVTSDPAGNRKLDKAKATGRIDALIALVMALGRAKRYEGEADITSFLSAPIRSTNV